MISSVVPMPTSLRYEVIFLAAVMSIGYSFIAVRRNLSLLPLASSRMPSAPTL